MRIDVAKTATLKECKHRHIG